MSRLRRSLGHVLWSVLIIILAALPILVAFVLGMQSNS